MRDLLTSGRSTSLPATRQPTAMLEPGPVLLWVRTGVAQVIVADAHYEVAAGQAIWVPAGQPHLMETARDSVALPIRLPATHSRTGPDRPRVITVPPSWGDWLVYEFARTIRYLPGAVRDSQDLLRLIGGSEPAGGAGQDTTLRAPPLPQSREALLVAQALQRDPGDRRSLAELAAQAGTSLAP